MKKRENNHLAEGEATGHYHRAIGNDVEVFELEEEKIVLLAPNGSIIEHQEHKHIIIPPGEYAIERTLEYDHFLEESKEVKD